VQRGQRGAAGQCVGGADGAAGAGRRRGTVHTAAGTACASWRPAHAAHRQVDEGPGRHQMLQLLLLLGGHGGGSGWRKGAGAHETAATAATAPGTSRSRGSAAAASLLLGGHLLDVQDVHLRAEERGVDVVADGDLHMALHGIEDVRAERQLGIRLDGLDLGAQVIGDGQLTLAQESGLKHK